MKRSHYLNFFIVLSAFFTSSIKAEELPRPCPESLGFYQCQGWTSVATYSLGTAIGMCAAENGSVSSFEGAKFAYKYARDRLSRGARDSLINYINDSTNYELNKSGKMTINEAGGCAMLLNKYYPKFSKPLPKEPSDLRDTMSDTPFSW